MGNLISVTVYDFGSAGNKRFKTTLMGLPTKDMFVEVARSPDPNIYCYSIIRYPALGLAIPEGGYLTAQTVAQIITLANA